MKTITVDAEVFVPMEKVWGAWIRPDDIKSWCFASPEWGVGDVENDVRVGGKFKTNMHALDKSAGFDFAGVYNEVVPNRLIVYTMDDTRVATVHFEEIDGGVRVTETFEMESENSEELQRGGWQSILNNFKKYTEGIK
mgnify:CR=1 FL=1